MSSRFLGERVSVGGEGHRTLVGGSLLDFLPGGTLVVIDEPADVEAAARAFHAEADAEITSLTINPA